MAIQVTGSALFRKRLVDTMESLNARDERSAVSLQEISDKWDFGGIEAVRMMGLRNHLGLLFRRKIVAEADSGRYYLVTK